MSLPSLRSLAASNPKALYRFARNLIQHNTLEEILAAADATQNMPSLRMLPQPGGFDLKTVREFALFQARLALDGGGMCDFIYNLQRFRGAKL